MQTLYAKLRSILFASLTAGLFITMLSCSGPAPEATAPEAAAQNEEKPAYPSEVLPLVGECKITLGNGSNEKNLIAFADENFFYTTKADGTDWVVYKTPNVGGTTKNSSNTRSELHQVEEWLPKTGGKLTGTLKVMHVSTSGDARVAASYSVVVGQIHGSEGHENEPIKIFYKKFPGHERGSVFWNYEINTAGDDNSERWDFSTAVWGHDMSVVGTTPDSYPEEPEVTRSTYTKAICTFPFRAKAIHHKHLKRA